MTFKPVFQATPHLLKVLEECASLHSKIQESTVGVSWVPTLQRDTAARQAHSSTAIEGNPLTLREVKILADGGNLPHAKPRSVQEVLNYLAALRFVERQEKVSEISKFHVLKLHSIIGQKGALDREPIGAYRTYRVRVGHHLPPEPKDVPKLMEDLLVWLNGAGKAWPAIISAAILHCQFETIHPFGDGNGRVGRALMTWELYRKQYDNHHIFAIDEFFWEERESYYRALHRAQIEHQDFTGWVEYVAECILLSLERGWSRIEAIHVTNKAQQITLTPRQEKLLSLLRRGPMTIQEIQSEIKVGKSGAHHILKPLLKCGLVERSGGHKTGKYRLK
jgi:Fic family protein